MADFKEITTMKYWCQKVLPLVYDDSLSYYELLNKVVKKLNDLITNNEQLPEYISNLIQQYISSGAIGEVVRNILTDFMLNVKNPPNDLKPAVGDGSADDTEAIQGCIDYASANGGMCVYFPSGSYLTKPLIIKDNVSLFGFDRYNTKLVLRGGATQGLLTGNVEDFSISGMTLDGNMDIQVNNINLIDMNVDSVILSNMVLTDGYTLVRLTVNKILQMDNLVFDYSVVKHMELSGSGSVSANNIYMHDISVLKGECLLDLQNNNSTFTNMFALGDTPLGYKIAGNNNSISGVIRNATLPYTDTGNNNSITILGVTENIKMTGDYSHSNNNSTETSKGQKTINAENIKLNPTQPLEYKDPTPLDEYFKTIPFKNGNNNYDVLVKGEKGVKEAIEKEISDRQEADNALSIAIDNEELSRQDADNTLDVAIKQEVTDRENADTQLDTKFTGQINDLEERVNTVIDGEIADINQSLEDLTTAFNLSKVGIINVLEFGVKGDGITDDSTIINQCIVNNPSKTLYLPAGKTYLLKSTVVIACKQFICLGTIKIVDDIVALQLKTNDSKVYVQTINGGGTGVGFQVKTDTTIGSLGNSFITINRIFQLSKGIHLFANDNTGVQNETFTLNRIDWCVIGIHFECGDRSTPWVNQNTFIGGWINGGDAHTTYTGIKFTKGANQIDKFNGNSFHDQSYEQTRYPIDIVFAWNNVWQNIRLLENTGTDLIKCGVGTEHNTFIGLSTYILYTSITDTGVNNRYKTQIARSGGNNVCSECTFLGGKFIPMDIEYYGTKAYTFTQGTGLEDYQIVDYIKFDGSVYNVQVILNPKYSYGLTANSFLLETGVLAGFAKVILWNGQIIASSLEETTISPVRLKANSRYMFYPTTGNNNWLVSVLYEPPVVVPEPEV